MNSILYISYINLLHTFFFFVRIHLQQPIAFVFFKINGEPEGSYQKPHILEATNS